MRDKLNLEFPACSTPSIALFGAGYVLTRFAVTLPSNAAVLVRRSPAAHCQSRIHLLDCRDEEAVTRLLQSMRPPLVIIDSVPPAPDGSVDANRTLVKCASGVAITRAIYLSSTAVYDRRDGEWVTEEQAADPKSSRGRSRIAAEEIYAGAPFASVVLRLSGIYGPGRGIGVRLKERSYRLSAPSRFTNRIHVDDIIAVLTRLVYEPPPLGTCEVFNVSDDEPVRIGDLVDYYVTRFGLPPPPAATEPSEREEQNQRVSNEKLKRIFAPFKLIKPNYKDGAGTEWTP